MCIIILNTKEHLSKELIEECWQANNDGAGLMYGLNGKLTIFKELKNFNTYYEYYSTLRKEFKKIKIGLHFRLITSGKIDTYNIHPFKINDKLAFMHNGIIDIPLQKDSRISDTIAFNQKILKQLPSNFLNNRAITNLISRYIGRSKLLFMNNCGRHWIINEDLGHWDKNGNWFSNFSYCESSFINEQSNIFWTDEIDDYEICQFCGIELLEDRELEYETCFYCMRKYALELPTHYALGI
jgi:predicted glutamine amidotransferase